MAFLSLLTNVARETQESRILDLEIFFGGDGNLCDGAHIICPSTRTLPCIDMVLYLCTHAWLSNLGTCKNDIYFATPPQKLKQVQVTIKQQPGSIQGQFFLPSFVQDPIYMSNISLHFNCKGTYEILSCIGWFCNKTNGLDAFLNNKKTAFRKQAISFFQCAMSSCARIKSVKIFMDKKKKEDTHDLIHTLKAVTSCLALHTKKKSDSEYFLHPEHKIIRSFACLMMAVMRLSGHLVILNDPIPQIFEYSSSGKILSALFYEDFRVDPDYKEQELVACANSMVWGTGCSSFGCPVSVCMSALPEEAIRESLHAYGDHEHFGSLCCCWDCFYSCISILLAEGAIDSADEVKGVTYRSHPFVFIAPNN
jgi:hypothetical protein